MKTLFHTSLPCLIILLISCESKSDKTEQPVAPTATSTVSPALPIQSTTTSNTNLPAVSNASGPELNPEHGKPGHRCDIAVGAPLNSPAVNKPAPSITTSVPATNASQKLPTLPVTQAAPGMNPKHGEPGHRCDIAVGAPLNSAPANKTPKTTTPPNLPVINTALNPTNSSASVAPGMNPKHGEPGHRCDIAVGAPLDSKPKQ